MTNNLKRGSAVLALLISACGGGGSSEGVSVVPGTSPTPSPAPTPTPTSTPTPISGPTTGEIKPTADAIVSAAVMELTRTENTTGARSVQADTAFQLSYVPASRTYTLSDAVRTQSFGPAQFAEETSAPVIPPAVTFRITTAAGRDFLLIAKAPSANPPVVPRFGAYGAWQHTVDLAGGSKLRLNYFTYGSPTPSGSMPRSGKVRYRIVGTGNYARDDGLFLTQSDTVVDVDFNTGIVAAVATLNGDDFLTGGFGGLIGFRVRGTIAGNVAIGDIDSDIATVSGRFKFIFYGPNAEELALVTSGGDSRASFVTAGVGVLYRP